MARIVYDVSMSLDGFIAADGRTPEHGLGAGGDVLHDWYFAKDGAERQGLHRYDCGAHLVGRRTYDTSIKWWGDKGPDASPTIIVSHDAPDDVPGEGVYTFVDGVMPAIGLARIVSGDKDIGVMGGDLAAQILRAGFIDEITIHLVPVLFGAGLPLFGEGPGQLPRHLFLEPIETITGAAAIHLRYRVKPPAPRPDPSREADPAAMGARAHHLVTAP